ncbi:MAG TPA: tetratricopeptide repeat protein [Acidobacteriaceae bacterium]|nr:tetratricopeptide repeat protein [Acidobacteriaceae bacterium]
MTVWFRASRFHRLRVACFIAVLTALAVPSLSAQNSGLATASSKRVASQSDPDRSSAYFHYALAHMYEEMAVNAGREDYATQAIEEYKLALNADPNSPMLQDGLAELYFKIGHVKDAVTAAQDQVKRNPNDVQAHTLLGQVYLRSLGDMQGSQSAEMLRLAIAEYETIDRLKPDDLETKLLLGQLYALNHDTTKAEAEFKDAQKIDADSEEVVLNMAQLYAQQGDSQRAVDTLSAIPLDDRSARIEFEIGANYDQLKKPKEAAAAYRRSLDLEPDNPEAAHALGNALLADDQMDEALKVFQPLVAADPADVQSEIHIAEILRRQGHYDEALATLEKAKSQPQAPDSPELNFNEALIYDAQGKYDQATAVLTGMLDALSHPDGKYSEQEKQNRAIFLNRLALIYREQNKTAEAVAAYKQIVDMGGDCGKAAAADDQAHPCYARDGYQGEIDAYRDAHQWKDAAAVAADAAKTMPKDRLVQLMYAQQLADMGQVDQGLALAKAQLGGAQDRDVEEDLTQMYIRLKRFPEASAYLEKAAALATTPDQKLYIIFLRGELYDRQKMHDQAETQFRQALTLDPDNAEILNYLGYMLADEGEKLPEALKLISKAVELDPQNGAFLDSLGWVYFKTGQYPEAEENLRKANERMNTDPTVHDHLGEVYEKTGKLKMAVAQWERSMTEYAHSLPADADPEDVQKVQHKLEEARVKLAKVNTAAGDKDAH